MKGYFRGHSGKVSDGGKDKLDQRRPIKVQCRPDSLMTPPLEQFTKPYISALPTQDSASVPLLPSLFICTNHVILSLCQIFPERGPPNWFLSILMSRAVMSKTPLASGSLLVQLSKGEAHMYQHSCYLTWIHRNTEKPKPSYSVDGNEKWSSHFEIHFGSF